MSNCISQVIELGDQMTMVTNVVTDVKILLSDTNSDLSSISSTSNVLDGHLRNNTEELDRLKLTVRSNTFRTEQMQNDTDTLSELMNQAEKEISFIENLLGI